jgi:Ser/Thr protein kinase RdoA (MazF antagonist)
MDEQPSNPVTSTTVRRVAAQLGLQVSRVRATRSADADSLGNGNWHVWTVERHRFVLRRYHTLRTERDLSYESQVLRHLAARGWCRPQPPDRLLTAAEKEAVEPLERVFRVNMVMAELWGATRTGRFDFEMIERQLSRTGTASP